MALVWRPHAPVRQARLLRTLSLRQHRATEVFDVDLVGRTYQVRRSRSFRLSRIENSLLTPRWVDYLHSQPVVLGVAYAGVLAVMCAAVGALLRGVDRGGESRLYFPPDAEVVFPQHRRLSLRHFPRGDREDSSVASMSETSPPDQSGEGQSLTQLIGGVARR